MANMLHMAGWFVSDLLRNKDSRSARDQANEHHTAALGLLDQLLDAIQEPEGAGQSAAGCSGAGERCWAPRAAGKPDRPGRATKDPRRALNRPEGLRGRFGGDLEPAIERL
jgi:hypothetical protein